MAFHLLLTIGQSGHRVCQTESNCDAKLKWCRKLVGLKNGVPPRRLLTAIGAEDDRPTSAATANPLASMLSNLLRGNTQTEQGSTLPADPLALLSCPNVHWAGNSLRQD
ncbi:MAG: hypothetical protein ABI614_26850 [Planctomycetota bacterium]